MESYNLNQYKEEDFKIFSIYQDIIKSYKENIITFISSKTGSGKSTQVPKYLYEYLKKDEKKSSFKIICSEPRSIACQSISNFVHSRNKEMSIDTNPLTYIKSSESCLFFIKESDMRSSLLELFRTMSKNLTL